MCIFVPLTNGKIYLVPTPIGNLEDITLRALNILSKVKMIFAEDTRITIKLLNHYKIDKPLKSLHAHNEHKMIKDILEKVQMGATIAYCSDAGTPGISDPGYLLVREAIKSRIPVETLPGATAFVPALVNSGIPCDRFVFEGFLPAKKGRKKRLKQMAEEERTTIFYESPHRLIKTLEELHQLVGPDRQICIAKELTKMHETFFRGKLGALLQDLSKKSIKGEFVVVLQSNGTKFIQDTFSKGA